MPHPFVYVQAQERAEHLAPFAGVCLEEPGKLPLRQDDRLLERVDVEAEERLHRLRRVPDLVGAERIEIAAVVFLQTDDGRSLAAQGARDTETTIADVKIEPDAHPLAPGRDHLFQVVFADARNFAIQREQDGVEQRRLAGAGRTGNRKQVKAVEVDLLLLLEAGKTFDREMNGPHRQAFPAACSWSRPNSASTLGAGSRSCSRR